MGKKPYQPFGLLHNALDAGNRWEDYLCYWPRLKRWGIVCICAGLATGKFGYAMLLFVMPYILFALWWVVWAPAAFVIDVTIGAAYLRWRGGTQ